MSHDVNQRHYAIWSVYPSIEILRILPISIIDDSVKNLKYQMHDDIFQNIEGLCFLLVPMKSLYQDGTGSNYSLNFDTFHFHILTFFPFLTYIELLYSKNRVTIVFCVSSYPTWGVRRQIGPTVRSKSRLRKIEFLLKFSIILHGYQGHLVFGPKKIF